MKSYEKGMPWWLNVIIGVLIIVAGILILANTTAGNEVLIILVGIGVLIYSIFNIYKAVQFRNDNRLFIPYLAQGLLDLVLLLLIITINNSPVLLGIVIACWLIVFGFFEILHARRDGGDDNHRIRIGTLLLIAGIALIVISLLFQDGFMIFLGILALIIGLIKTIQGIMYKVRYDERTSGGRSNLL